MKRRTFLALGALGSLAGSSAYEWWQRRRGEDPYLALDPWDGGEIHHILPTVDHQRIRCKISLRHPQPQAPILRVGSQGVAGVQTDSEGYFWVFDRQGLTPESTYALRLTDAKGKDLSSSWTLKTFPAPDSRPRRFRLLSYTCAGGPNFFIDFKLKYAFLPIHIRQKLLARALQFRPDAAIANGDHVYWDMQSKMGWGMGLSPMARWRAGLFDRQQAILGTANEQVLKRGFGPQISELYRTMLRGVPSFFLQDDHDFMENDEPSRGRLLFPPDRFMKAVGRATQGLFLPEFLSAPSYPKSFLDGSISRDFGSLRFGRLFEGLFYNCRSQMSTGKDGAFLPADAEKWLCERLRASSAEHVVQIPSTPFLWTAGKWGEWYPDAITDDGGLDLSVAKAHWSPGWNRQHDRILTAAHRRKDRLALTVSGDMHAVALGKITRSKGLDFRSNPIYSLLSGPLGTGEIGWPSNFRDRTAKASRTLSAQEWVPPIEENGFTLLDFTPKAVEISMFRWAPAMGVNAIARLQPFRRFTLERGRG